MRSQEAFSRLNVAEAARMVNVGARRVQRRRPVAGGKYVQGAA